MISRFQIFSFRPPKKSQALQNGFLNFWKLLKKRHISCYISKNMSKFKKIYMRWTTLVRIKWIMIKICNVSFIVFSPFLPRDPELCKKIWPFEIYIIRMIYKKAYLVIFLSKIITYRRQVNISIEFWCLRPLDFRL